MFLKHVPRTSRCADAVQTAQLFETGPEIHLGTGEVIDLVPSIAECNALMGLDTDQMWKCDSIDEADRIIEVTEGPEADRVYWPVKFAWWRDSNLQLHGVITTGDLYVLGPDGKTIDRA
jgi:hypothetical protein